MPFGPYADFDDCVAQNGDKLNPAAYCAAVESTGATMRRVRMQLTPMADIDGDGLDDITGIAVETEVKETDDDIVEDIDDEMDDFHTLVIVEGTWTGDGRYVE